jgi:hypothetical protein
VPSESLHHSYTLPENAMLYEYVASLISFKLELMLLYIGLVGIGNARNQANSG